MKPLNLYKLITHAHKHLLLSTHTHVHTHTSTYFEDVTEYIMTGVGIGVRVDIKEQIIKEENDFAWLLMLVCQ